MHARSLFGILEAAVAASTLAGCCFGRSYGPTERSTITQVDGSRLATASADGTLSDATCQDICGPLSSEETLLGCWASNLELAPKDRPRRLTWQYRNADDSTWQNNSTMLSPERARVLEGSDPEHLDPGVCLAFHRKEEGVSVRNCSFGTFPPAPPRGAAGVLCRKRRAGGCDMSFGSGRDTRARATALGDVDAENVGSWLACAAAAERTSVRAFEEMAVELARFGAPRSLVRAAKRARRDEIRHAATMTRLARTRGACPGRVRFRKTPARSLEAFTLENAVEGCVRELFGAAVAIHQSQHAATALRPAFARIARDETRHAALALRTFQWCAGRLDDKALARAFEAIDAAAASLTASWTIAAPEVGWPSASAARSIANHLQTHAWSKLV